MRGRAWIVVSAIVSLSAIVIWGNWPLRERPVLPGRLDDLVVTAPGALPSIANQTAPPAVLSSATGSYLQIDKLNLRVPIRWDVNGFDEQAYLEALAGGVAHFAGTAQPGAPGNVFVFGHSGYRRALPNDYHRVFRQLDRLDRVDQVLIVRNATVFTYQVTEEREVAADDLSVLEPTDTEVLTLMTCWPPGTLDARYIVRATRVAD